MTPPTITPATSSVESRSPRARAEVSVRGGGHNTAGLALRGGDETVAAGASTREVALAGKGFSEEVEREFRKTNAEADFQWVDRMERFVVDYSRVAAFLREGGVAPKGGTR